MAAAYGGTSIDSFDQGRALGHGTCGESMINKI